MANAAHVENAIWYRQGIRCIHLRRDAFIFVTHSYLWLIRICDSFMFVTHSYLWHTLHSPKTWRIRIRDFFIFVTHSYLWLIHICDSFMLVTHSYVWHGLHSPKTWLIRHMICEAVQIWILHVSHMHESCPKNMNESRLSPTTNMNDSRLRAQTWLTHTCDSFIFVAYVVLT